MLLITVVVMTLGVLAAAVSLLILFRPPDFRPPDFRPPDFRPPGGGAGR
ncbi:hypothetical protein ACWDLG_29985 [Nonomuraea sp. NPDC003727]